jgi:hypothetical protein
VIFQQLLRGIITTNVCVYEKLNPFGCQQICTALNQTLFKFHVGYAVHQKTTDSVGTLKHSYPMAGLIKLSRGSQSSRARTNNRHPLSRATGGWLR